MAWRTFFPTRNFVGQYCLFILCLGSDLVIKLPFAELDCMPKSFRSVVLIFGNVQNSPRSLEMLLAKTESSCTTCIGNILYAPIENENAKTMSLNICEKGKEQWNVKIPLEGYKKRSKKKWLNICYIQILLTLKIWMPWMKAAISCAFKHWWSPKGSYRPKRPWK